MSTPENPFAFPCNPNVFSSDPGMTLRDWYAGQALAGLSAAVQVVSPERAAQLAYEAADAMLAERAKVKP